MKASVMEAEGLYEKLAEICTQLLPLVPMIQKFGRRSAQKLPRARKCIVNKEIITICSVFVFCFNVE